MNIWGYYGINNLWVSTSWFTKIHEIPIVSFKLSTLHEFASTNRAVRLQLCPQSCGKSSCLESTQALMQIKNILVTQPSVNALEVWVEQYSYTSLTWAPVSCEWTASASRVIGASVLGRQFPVKKTWSVKSVNCVRAISHKYKSC